MHEVTRLMTVMQFFKKIGFELDLNVSRDGAFITWLGRLFHAVGPETDKEQLTNFVEDRGTYSRL